MGTFWTAVTIAHYPRRFKRAQVPHVLVDTGSEHTWIGARILEALGIRREKKDLLFITATGATVTRAVGYALIQVVVGKDRYETIDEIVFAEPGDLNLLGARTLEGLNLTVEPRRKRLTAAGPIPAA